MILLAFGWRWWARLSEAERFVRHDRPRLSPSGAFTASLQPGPEQNGVATWRVVIAEAGGAELFRDEQVYSARHGVGVTWLSTRDQLWILSADVGDAFVERRDNGNSWDKILLTPTSGPLVPEEIARLRGRR